MMLYPALGPPGWYFPLGTAPAAVEFTEPLRPINVIQRGRTALNLMSDEATVRSAASGQGRVSGAKRSKGGG